MRARCHARNMVTPLIIGLDHRTVFHNNFSVGHSFFTPVLASVLVLILKYLPDNCPEIKQGVGNYFNGLASGIGCFPLNIKIATDGPVLVRTESNTTAND